MSLVLKYAVRILCLWVMCSLNCEYRDYKWGHKFVKAFDAKTLFQWVFTVLQSRRTVAYPGEITYIGYWSSIVTTVAALAALLVSAGSPDRWYIFEYAYLVCAGLNMAGVLLQVMDSVLNRMLHG